MIWRDLSKRRIKPDGGRKRIDANLTFCSDEAMSDRRPRPGEITAEIDPARSTGDARLVFIGHAETPWTSRSECPHNLRQARERVASERPGKFVVHVDGAWRPGLKDLKAGDPIIVLYWMDQAARNLIVQAPRHSETTRGVFSLRSPVRPNPIALAVVRIVEISAAAGCIEVDALDCVNGTPVIDIKPWIDRIDVLP